MVYKINSTFRLMFGYLKKEKASVTVSKQQAIPVNDNCDFKQYLDSFKIDLGKLAS